MSAEPDKVVDLLAALEASVNAAKAERMKTRRDFECSVDEVDPLVPRAVRCGFVWGDHDEHRCDALDARCCFATTGRLHHICGCGAAVWEQR